VRPTLKRALAPATNPTGIGSSAAAIYAAVVMIWNATHHHTVIDPQVVIAALTAAAFLYSRMKVTPVADPKDGNGQPLLKAATAAMLAGTPPYRSSTGNVTVIPPEKTLIPPAAPPE
jgi:hypothetical protein